MGKKGQIEKELEILRKRIIELEFFMSEREHSEEILRDALRQAYDDLEKRASQQIADLISINRQIQQKIADYVQAEYALYYRVEFEKLIITISINLIKISRDKIHSAIKNALKRIGEFVGVDCCYVLIFSRDRKQIVDIFEWCAKGINPYIQNLLGHFLDKEFPWFVKKISRHGVLYVPYCNSLPPEAQPEKNFFQTHGIQSFITIRMRCGSSFIGCVGFDSVRMRKTWALDIIVLLRMVGEIFVNVLESGWTEETFMKSKKKVDHCSNVFQKRKDYIIDIERSPNLI